MEKLTQARLNEYESQKRLMEAEKEFEEEREEWRDLKRQLLPPTTSVCSYSKEDNEETVSHCRVCISFFIQ